ncbi:MAG: T9SS type A sorting domain-containing protein [Bacteroidales bacterium]|nr:T9SS type A sorting domain-containing protein [Bacteroidales bacterium]
MRLKIFHCIFFLLLSFCSFSQYEEIIVNYSPDIQLKSQEDNFTELKSLPFFDDFAYPYTKPLPSLWQDDDAYVNSAFAKNVKTIGVASLDAMASNGKLHENVSTTASVSDYLTSLPINLKTYELIYSSDKLYRKDGEKFSLLDESYFLYDKKLDTYIPVIQGTVYYAGDTLYTMVSDTYTAVKDSLFDENHQYIAGSYDCEHTFYEYQLEDSLALSFFYQAGGYVDAPEARDSLTLEFYVPYDTSGIFLNEICSSGIEIYNATDSIVDLTGYYLLPKQIDAVSEDSLSYYVLSSVVISSYRHAVISPKIFGVDSLVIAMAYLYSPEKKIVDSIAIGEKLGEDIVYARLTDGNPSWSYTATETLGECNPSWKWIWSTNQKTGDNFLLKYIAIDQPSYLVKGFRFRFKNYTSLSNDESHARNEDFWHLDVVWLNSHRSIENSNVPDVAFASEISALYPKYKALPMSHFANVEPNDFRMTIHSKFTNFDNDYRKVKFNFSVTKQHNGDELQYSTYETDIPADTTVSEADILMDFFDDDVVPNFIAQDIPLYKEGEYEFKYYFTDINNLLYSQYRWNDTCRTKLVLSNYYAYDDGTPEAGYGLRDAPMGRVAFKYDILESDTLKAISTYFNPTMLNVSTTFNLCVWDNENGLPGKLLYYSPTEKVKFADGMFEFVEYEIVPENIVSGDKSLVVGKTFFIGWEQPNDVLLNMGIDLNTTLNNRLYYNLGFQWESSVQKGALLLRPIFDFYTPKTSVEVLETGDLKLVPTVAKSQVNVLTNQACASVEVIDMLGQIVFKTTKDSFSVSSLENGCYAVKVLTESGKTFFAKLIVAK